jgi:[NiFe] hydrogenase diaphorase moiety large subunit
MLATEQAGLSHEIAALADKHGHQRASLLPILEAIQERHRQVSDFAMQEVARQLNIFPSEVYGTVTFYAFLSTGRKGRFAVRLCRTLSCDLAGKSRVARQLENELGIKFGETSPDGLFTLEYCNCLGVCDQGPALFVNDDVYARVRPEMVSEVLEKYRRMFGPPGWTGTHNHDGESWQESVAEAQLDSRALHIMESYEANAGLLNALTLTPGGVIQLIQESGIRGRGGAGFPTGMKWQACAAVAAPRKFLVCNADEGEPGTFKDRMLLTQRPDVLFDGMTIAAYAIGAQAGVLYLRAEYAYMRRLLEANLARRRQEGLLGPDVLKSGFAFDLEIRVGAGAYVCGEETALLESLEGLRGEPRNRPPYPVNAGFIGAPTSVNNVETLIACAHILAKGPEWFKKYGTGVSTGTKMLSVSGDCRKPGVYVVPWGITVGELLALVGGEGAKAVQVGGASGHTVPAAQFNRRLGFEDLATGGAIIVIGPGRDMLAVAENFLEFFVDESCGQCTLCREGNPKLLEGVRRLQHGQCSIHYLRELQALGRSMQVASKCGLGQSSANAFLDITENFRSEILGRGAPGGVSHD